MSSYVNRNITLKHYYYFISNRFDCYEANFTQLFVLLYSTSALFFFFFTIQSIFPNINLHIFHENLTRFYNNNLSLSFDCFTGTEIW